MRKRFPRFAALATCLAFTSCSFDAKPTASPERRAKPAPAAELAAAPGLPTPVERDDAWGYVDSRGQIVLPVRYRLAGTFSETGIAPVVDDEGWAYIDRLGQVLIRPMIYDNGPDPFSEGLARYVDHDLIGFFDTTGQIVIKARFDFATPFREGRAAICIDCEKQKVGEHEMRVGGRWGFIDRKGDIVIPIRFERAGGFSGGRAPVRIRGEERFIDLEGSVVD